MVRARLWMFIALLAALPLSAAKPTPTPTPGPEPDWEIVFVRNTTDRAELVLTTPTGTSTKLLVSVKNVANSGPSFTPDGRHVVFTSNLGGVAGIYSVRLKDSSGAPSIGTPTLLTAVTPYSASCNPTVSPEGILAFNDRVGGDTKGDLHLMGVVVDAAGDLRADPDRMRRNVTNTPDAYEVWPSWSIRDLPESRRLAFTRYNGSDALGYITCNGYTMECSSAVTVPVNLGGENLSIDGAVGWSKITAGLIAFGAAVAGTGTSSDLYFVDLDNPAMQGKLTDTPEPAEAGATWAPTTDNRLAAIARRNGDLRGVVIFEDILSRMASGPGGAETTVVMPKTKRENISDVDWRQ